MPTEATANPVSASDAGLPPARSAAAWRAAVMCGLLTAAGGAAWFTASLDMRGLRVAIVAGLSLPALILAVRGSWATLPYLLVIYAGNRELRRVMDWMQGGFHEKTVLSLLPLAAVCCLALAVAMRFHELPRRVRFALIAAGAALSYALVIGAGHGFGAIYELAGYTCPLIVLAYVTVMQPSPRTAHAWVRALGLVAAAAAVYGWVQFLWMPPWDAMWMKAVDMSSIGQPLPLKVRVFSSMPAPGPAAMFLGLALIPLLASHRWRRGVGWAAVLLIASGLLLTEVRSAWLMLLAALLVYAALGSGKERFRLVVALAVVTAAVAVAAPRLPGGKKVLARLQTLTSVSSDHSFQERLQFSQWALGDVLARPLGHGLGASGLAVRSTRGSNDKLVNFDNGFLNLLYTFGIPGSVLLAAAGAALWRELRQRAAMLDDEPPHVPDHAARLADTRLAQCVFVATILALAASNWLRNDAAGAMWMFVGIGLAPLPSRRKEQRFSSAFSGGTGVSPVFGPQGRIDAASP